jgi:putative transposase
MNTNWNLPPPPGFQGLREDLPLTVYERHLPHWRRDGATYFVTFRLEDSLPQSKLRELKSFKAEWERRHSCSCRMGFSPSRNNREELAHEVMRRVEAWLDEGMGSCVLRSNDVSAIMIDTMHRGDGVAHELGCYVVMPNHVHAIVRPLMPGTLPLESVLMRWKGGASVEINRKLQRSGPLWQQESFDRIIRDEEHLWRAIQYIGRNPRNAGLSPADAHLWIRPSWIELGWRFESEQSRRTDFSPSKYRDCANVEGEGQRAKAYPT